MSDFRSGLPIRLFDEDNLAYSDTNPLPVSIEESEGDEIHDYQVDVAVVKSGGSANHDYVVSAGKSFLFLKVLFAGSGRMKVEIQIEDGVAAATYTTKAVAFSSTAKLSDEVDLSKAITVAAGVNVRVIKTNLDNSDQDLYTTIIGIEN